MEKQRLTIEELQKRIDAPNASTWEKEYYEDMEARDSWKNGARYGEDYDSGSPIDNPLGAELKGWDYLVPDFNDDMIDDLQRYAG